MNWNSEVLHLVLQYLPHYIIIPALIWGWRRLVTVLRKEFQEQAAGAITKAIPAVLADIQQLIDKVSTLTERTDALTGRVEASDRAMRHQLLSTELALRKMIDETREVMNENHRAVNRWLSDLQRELKAQEARISELEQRTNSRG